MLLLNLGQDHPQRVKPDSVARALYISFMTQFPIPRDRPSFKDMYPVFAVDPANPLRTFTHVCFQSYYRVVWYSYTSRIFPSTGTHFISCRCAKAYRRIFRPPMHWPERTHWCGPDELHALLYNPTHDYWSDTKRWVTPPDILRLAGCAFDLFTTRGQFVYYAGVYTLRSMRSVAVPGAPIPVDVVSNSCIVSLSASTVNR
jgi:hypothetical protein